MIRAALGRCGLISKVSLRNLCGSASLRLVASKHSEPRTRRDAETKQN